jgi:hypothetical protein
MALKVHRLEWLASRSDRFIPEEVTGQYRLDTKPSGPPPRGRSEPLIATGKRTLAVWSLSRRYTSRAIRKIQTSISHLCGNAPSASAVSLAHDLAVITTRNTPRPAQLTPASREVQGSVPMCVLAAIREASLSGLLNVNILYQIMRPRLWFVQRVFVEEYITLYIPVQKSYLNNVRKLPTRRHKPESCAVTSHCCGNLQHIVQPTDFTEEPKVMTHYNGQIQRSI